MREQGATSILVAGSLLFLLGMAALAVDVSGFFKTARSDQTTADLACLAGVVHLPLDGAEAIDRAATVTRLNWAAMRYAAVMTTGPTTARMGDGSGSEVRFETHYGGDPYTMRVEVSEVTPTHFGKALGIDDVTVGQVATCQTSFVSTIYPTMPVGILPGGFSGNLFGPDPCGSSSGNCGTIDVPRATGGNELVDNIGDGLDRKLVPALGANPGVDCNAVGPDDECSQINSNPGVSASHIGGGFIALLQDKGGADCTFKQRGRDLDCDSPTQILGGAPTPLAGAQPSMPSWWDTSLYGPYSGLSAHYWYDGPIAKCDSPRLGVIPIVSADLTWDLGDPRPGWPNGRSDPVKVVGAADAIIIDPNEGTDFKGGGNLKHASAIIMWFGPNTTCADTGASYGILNGGNKVVDKTVKLVAD